MRSVQRSSRIPSWESLQKVSCCGPPARKEDALRYHQLPTSQSMCYCIPASSRAISDLCLSKAITLQGPFLIYLNHMCHHPSVPKVYWRWHCHTCYWTWWHWPGGMTRESRIVSRFCWSAAWGMMNPWPLNLSMTVRQHPRIMAWAMSSSLKQTCFRMA